MREEGISYILSDFSKNSFCIYTPHYNVYCKVICYTAVVSSEFLI